MNKQCPKCKCFSGDNWSQCEGSCPMPGSPSYKEGVRGMIETRANCIIVDIDGTVADLTHRRHFVATKPKRWGEFAKRIMDDTPILHIINSVRQFRDAGYSVILCSGREEVSRDKTVEWLKIHDVPFDALYMRPARDHRHDYIIKNELLDQILEDGWVPLLALDDRDQVVYKTWRSRGVLCIQVAPGDF